MKGGFPVVGIGSSAGGLDALQQLLHATPPDSGPAFVITAHIDPPQKSHLSELLGRCTTPVVQIENSIKVEPDHANRASPPARRRRRRSRSATGWG